MNLLVRRYVVVLRDHLAHNNDDASEVVDVRCRKLEVTYKILVLPGLLLKRLS